MGTTQDGWRDEMRIKKSGNITIRLGPKQVEDILTRNPRAHMGRHSILHKVEKAVAETFTNVAKDKAQERRANDICNKFRDSHEYVEAMKPFKQEKQKLWDKQRKENMDLVERESHIFQQMLQKLFNMACITEFVANSWSFETVARAKERVEMRARGCVK